MLKEAGAAAPGRGFGVCRLLPALAAACFGCCLRRLQIRMYWAISLRMERFITLKTAKY